VNSFATRDQRVKWHKVEIAISTAILLYICIRTCQCLTLTYTLLYYLQSLDHCNRDLIFEGFRTTLACYLANISKFRDENELQHLLSCRLIYYMRIPSMQIVYLCLEITKKWLNKAVSLIGIRCLSILERNRKVCLGLCMSCSLPILALPHKSMETLNIALSLR
jgi:hypothetical protein